MSKFKSVVNTCVYYDVERDSIVEVLENTITYKVVCRNIIYDNMTDFLNSGLYEPLELNTFHSLNHDSVRDDECIFIEPSSLYRAGFTGTVIEGIFENSFSNVYNSSLSDYKFRSDITFTIHTCSKYHQEKVITIPRGTVVVIAGAGNLGFLMGQLSLNTLCGVYYQGKHLYNNIGMEVHNFQVMF